MKKALRLLLIYFLLMIFGICSCSVLYTIYLQILNSVAGTKIDFFDLRIFLKSLFYVIPCFCFVIGSLLAFSHVRRRGGILQLLMYIFLMLLTWGVILPLSLKYSDNFDIQNINSSTLSEKQFRDFDKEVYYFNSNLDSEKNSTTVIIDKNHNGIVQLEQMSQESAQKLYEAAAPYKDKIIKDTFDENAKITVSNFQYLVSSAKTAFNSGWNYWLAFLSIGLVLSSLYGLSNLFAWRLVNISIVSVLTLLILCLNSVCLINPKIYFVINKINSTDFFSFLSRYMNEPFIVLLNLIFAILFIVIGTIRYFVMKKKQIA